MKRLGLIVLVAVMVGCGGATTGSSQATSHTPKPSFATYPPNFSVGPLPTIDVTIEPGDPTSTPQTGPIPARLGQAITITCDGANCLNLVVLKAQTATRYRDPGGDAYLDDVPEHKGNIFIAVQVRYTAIGPNADYNQFDWALYIDDEQVQDTAYVSNGPSPELSANDLPNGKKVTGWIVWEIPKTGKVVLSYEPGSNGSIFEIVLRSK